MVIGLHHAMVMEGDAQAKKTNYDEAGKFMDEFKKTNGSLICRELLGCDIFTPEGSKIAADKKLTATLCPKLVRSAAEILENQFGNR